MAHRFPQSRPRLKGLKGPEDIVRAYGSYPTEEEANDALAKQAWRHEDNRLDSVTQELVLVSALAALKVIRRHDMVTAAGAPPQWNKGTKPDKTNAAHCLPGRILLNARPLDNLSEWLSEDFLNRCGFKALPLSSKLRWLHGRTDLVDVSVNNVDSRLEIRREGNGLKALLASCVGQVVELSLRFGKLNPTLITDVCGQAFNYWQAVHKGYLQESGDMLTDRLSRASEDEKKDVNKHLLVVKSMFDRVKDTSDIPEALTLSGAEQVVCEVTKGSAGVDTAHVDARSASTQTETPADHDSGDGNRESL